ncbi:MAG: SPOR domain-containing protein [Methylococcales bacterium]|nr:SPOR domain-containing protein [Methylococcales bacterium]
MAETKDESARFAEDLDSMLDDAATGSGQFLDDEDALDKLLQETPEPEPEPEPADSGEPPMAEIDEFSELDDIFDDNSQAPKAPEPATPDEPQATPEFNIAEDDFLADDPPAPAAPNPPPAATPDPADAAANAALDARLKALEVSQQAFAGQLEKLIEQQQQSSQQNQETLTRLEQQTSSLQHKLEQSKKSSPLPAVALGLGILALLLGILGLVLVFKNSGQIDDLVMLTATLEETQAAIDPEQFNATQQQQATQLTAIEQQITTLQQQVTALEESSDALGEQLTEQAHEQTESLKPLQEKLEKIENQLGQVKSTRRSAQPSAKRKTTRRTTTAKKQNWVVHLVSFRQAWYAQRKAAEFQRLGIPVTVNKVTVKGAPWHRLSVPGFSNKNQANAYAERLKQQLQLQSVWISRE